MGALSLQAGSGGRHPQVRRWHLGSVLMLAISLLPAVCHVFFNTNPQHQQVLGQSGPVLLEAACVTESETLELSVAMEPVKDSCA